MRHRRAQERAERSAGRGVFPIANEGAGDARARRLDAGTGDRLEVNAAACEMFGYTAAEAVGTFFLVLTIGLTAATGIPQAPLRIREAVQMGFSRIVMPSANLDPDEGHAHPGGRQLDPDLDLWQTAKPFLERWMREQVGWRGLLRTIRHEAPFWAATLPQLPRLVHRALAEERQRQVQIAEQNRLRAGEARRRSLCLWQLQSLPRSIGRPSSARPVDRPEPP